MKKQLLHFVLTSCLAMMALMAKAETVGGLCGIEGDMMVSWELNLDIGLMTISGNGAMADYDDPSEAPWYSYSKSIIHLTVEDGITHVSQAGFQYLPYLKSVEMGESVVSIGDNAFHGTPLTIVQPLHWTGDLDGNHLPEGLLTVGSYAFAETGLENITLPNTLEIIYPAAFAYNENLQEVKSLAMAPPQCGRAVFFECGKLYVIHVPDDYVADYKAAGGWATYADVIYAASQHADNPNDPQSDLALPYNTYVSDLGKTTALVVCSLPEGAIGWNLQYRQEAGDNEEEMRWVAYGNLTTRSYTIEELTPATNYVVRMQAVYSGGKLSGWTRALPFTTAAEEQDNKQVTAFNEYKEVMTAECDAMAMPEIDDDHCRALIAQAKTDVMNVAFDTNKTFEENLAALIAIVDQLGIDLYNYRSTLPESKATGVTIDETTFPDENFRKWVLSQKYGKDGILTDEEIAEVKDITVSYEEIANMKGIENFTELETLFCGGGKLTELDVSKNAKLKWLRCTQTGLTSIDVSKNAALTQLYVGNNQLTALDVSNNPLLEDLNFYNNKLTTIDVSHNPALKELSCYYNPITSLDITKNTALEGLWVNETKITSLDVTKNTALKSLYCYGNSLTTLDVTKNTALENLDCNYNELTVLDMTHNTKLKRLRCYGNKLTALDVSNAPDLRSLECWTNQLTALNVTQNPLLEVLQCYQNEITALDLTKNTKLIRLNCSANQLKTLDLSQNTALQSLGCNTNQLTALDLTANTALTDIAIHRNAIKGAAMDAFITSLPVITVEYLGNMHAIYPEGEGNIITTTQVEAAKAKGWKPMYFDRYWKAYDGTDGTSLEGVKATGRQTEGAWYDLSGRRLTQPIQKGIYINSGKKIVVK